MGKAVNEVILYGGLPLRRTDVYTQALKDTGDKTAADRFAFGPDVVLAPEGTEPLTLSEFEESTARGGMPRRLTLGPSVAHTPSVATPSFKLAQGKRLCTFR